jgi:hypothetical protein
MEQRLAHEDAYNSLTIISCSVLLASYAESFILNFCKTSVDLWRIVPSKTALLHSDEALHLQQKPGLDESY